MDRELKEQIRPEYSKIFDIVADAVDNSDSTALRMQIHVPLSADFFDAGADIAQALMEHFPNRAAFVVLDVRAHPEALDITAYVPPKYSSQILGRSWVVAAPDENCWVFGVSNEESARSLVHVLNSPSAAKTFHLTNPGVRVERALLTTVLFELRDQGIGLTSCRYRSQGVLESHDLLA